MGGSKSEARCKKHPKHKQSPGVCSCCLRERLSQLSYSSSGTANACSSSTCSSSSYYSSPSSCSSDSPSPSRHLYSDTNGMISFRLFRSSRSAAIAGRYRVRDASVGAEMKKKGGFWSKLIKPTNKKRREDFMHSKTMRETAGDRVYTI